MHPIRRRRLVAAVAFAPLACCAAPAVAPKQEAPPTEPPAPTFTRPVLEGRPLAARLAEVASAEPVAADEPAPPAVAPRPQRAIAGRPCADDRKHACPEGLRCVMAVGVVDAGVCVRAMYTDP